MIETPAGFQLWAQRNFLHGPDIQVFGFCKGGRESAERYRLTGFEFVKVTPDNEAEDARSFRLQETAAQVLMDTLWNCGIRPTEGAGTAGAMAAAQAHLQDLRSINTKLVDYVTREQRKAKA